MVKVFFSVICCILLAYVEYLDIRNNRLNNIGKRWFKNLTYCLLKNVGYSPIHIIKPKFHIFGFFGVAATSMPGTKKAPSLTAVRIFSFCKLKEG